MTVSSATSTGSSATTGATSQTQPSLGLTSNQFLSLLTTLAAAVIFQPALMATQRRAPGP